MLSFLFDLLSLLIHGLLGVLKYCSQALFAVLSFLSSLLVSPIKWLLSFFHEHWGLPLQWTSLYLPVLFFLFLLLALLGVWALASGLRRKK